MEKILLRAEKRTEVGKGAARTLRRQGMLPAVLYGGGISTPIKLQRKEIIKLFSSGAIERTLIAIELSDGNAGKTDYLALIKDYQFDPVKKELLHIDFIEISLEKKIRITVPVVITKEPAGVKKGGILQHLLREVQIECLPARIPERIEVDAGGLEIGHTLHVSDLVLEAGVRVLDDPQAVILTISAPVLQEAIPAAPAEVVEPGLVKKTKVKEEEPAIEEEKPKKEQRAQKEKS